MDGFNVTSAMFFAVLEVALVLFLLALGFVVRSVILAGRVKALQRMAGRRKQQPAVETVSFSQYLGDEVDRNQELVTALKQSGQTSERQAAGLLQLRGRFLEREVEAQAVADDTERFKEKLITGISAMIDDLQAQTTLNADTPASARQQERATINTEQAELESLRQVINNQQDALTALREELRSRGDSIDGRGRAGVNDDEAETTSAAVDARPARSAGEAV